MQRFLRGCIGRMKFKIHKEKTTRKKREQNASLLIQKLYRGYKGREAFLIESELRKMEEKAKPLIVFLKKLKAEHVKITSIIKRTEEEVEKLSSDIVEITRELDQCEKTTSKYTDSSRLNDTPQRFLTNFLKIRLKDLLQHETVFYFYFVLFFQYFLFYK
jgi:chromosome segregation ATPase